MGERWRTERVCALQTKVCERFLLTAICTPDRIEVFNFQFAKTLQKRMRHSMPITRSQILKWMIPELVTVWLSMHGQCCNITKNMTTDISSPRLILAVSLRKQRLAFYAAENDTQGVEVLGEPCDKFVTTHSFRVRLPLLER